MSICKRLAGNLNYRRTAARSRSASEDTAAALFDNASSSGFWPDLGGSRHTASPRSEQIHATTGRPSLEYQGQSWEFVLGALGLLR